MVSLQNQGGSLDTTDLPSWVIAKLGFAVLSWEIQCLSSALCLNQTGIFQLLKSAFVSGTRGVWV